MASIAETKYSLIAKQLIKDLLCLKHTNERRCWKPTRPPFRGEICVTLMPSDIELWATSIKNGSATYSQPPNNEHWWRLEAQFEPGSRRCPRKPPTPEPRQRESTFRIEIANASAQQHATPHARRGRTNSLISSATCTPVKGFHPREYNTAGLQAFLKWMSNYYEDQDYEELFSVLQDQKLGIDLFKKALHNSTQASKLEVKLEKANVKSGMIDRLMTDFENWYTEHLKDVSTSI